MSESQLRNYIRKIISEQTSEPQTTQRRGKGRYKKSIEAIKLVPPAELMSRLKAKKAVNGTDSEKLMKFLDSASSGVGAMKIVYASPSLKQDPSGKKGALIPLNSIKGGSGTIPPRDGRRYIEHTVNAGVSSGYLPISKNGYQIEIYGKGVLVYLANKPYTWGRSEVKKKQKDESHHGVDEELLGEPDLSQEDERDEDKEKDEFNVSANVAGVVTPLGTGPDGGKGKKKNSSPRERAIDANTRAFGGGEIYSSKKKKK